MSDQHIDIDGSVEPKSSSAGTGASAADEMDFEDYGPNRATMFSDIFRRFRGRPGFGLGENPLEEFLPAEAREHFRTSQREFLLGWRSLIDRALERIDLDNERQGQVPPASANPNPNKIIVEEVDF